MQAGLTWMLTGSWKSPAAVSSYLLTIMSISWTVWTFTKHDDLRIAAIQWPHGTGYFSGTSHRPSTPHDVQPCGTKAEIETVTGDSWLFGERSQVEFRESRMLVIHPGAEITYLCREPEKLTLTDMNGDECTVSYGLTVKMNMYGEFIPIRFLPD